MAFTLTTPLYPVNLYVLTREQFIFAFCDFKKRINCELPPNIVYRARIRQKEKYTRRIIVTTVSKA